MIALLERYIGLKQGVGYNTRAGYKFVLNLVKQEDFGCRQIGSIKVSDAQQWIIKLHKDGGLRHHHQRSRCCKACLSNGL